ncbi:MAG: 50S ribosomal protein L3 [Acidobacteriota bacterium]
MIEGLIGKKIGMTQLWNEKGEALPVTILKAGPCVVVQKKYTQKDGYNAVQLSLVEEKPPKKIIKPILGHFTKANGPPSKVLREFRYAKDEREPQIGDKILVDIFENEERVNVTGVSKGKGFAGVVKRWHFKGGPASHGSMFHRRPGSIGASSFPSRVFKGQRMPGRMGHHRVTVKNLKIIKIDVENDILVIKGAVSGSKGSICLIKKASFMKE